MAISSAAPASSNTTHTTYAKSKLAEAAGANHTARPSKQSNDEDGDDGLKTAVHSVVAGVLGLNDPKAAEPSKDETNGYYTTGKWLAAAGTLGTILSVLA